MARFKRIPVGFSEVTNTWTHVMGTSCVSRSEKASVNPEKEYIFQELLGVNWTQLTIAGRSLSHILHFSEKPQMEQPVSCTLLLPSEPTLINSSWAHLSTVRFRPVLSNWKGPSISSFASFMANQSGFIRTNQGRAIWTNQTVWIWIPNLHNSGPIRGKGRT